MMMLGCEMVSECAMRSEAVPDALLSRGSITIEQPTNNASGANRAYPIVNVNFARPPELKPPSFLMLQLHTTGL